LEQSKRFFAVIAVGGTLGAVFGPWLASVLANRVGTPALLLISSAFLMLAVGAAWLLARLQPEVDHEQAQEREQELIGGGAWDGVKAVFQSRFLLGISAYVVILAVVATLLYFTRLQMVAALGKELDARTTLFAQIDVITQVATLVIQLLVAGRLMKRFGVPVTLAILPATCLLGFIGLAIVGTLATLIAFESAFRAVQRAIMRPARETLFTVMSREDKYKSKAFIDTFVYRAGDVTGAQLEGGLARLGMGLAAIATVAVPLTLVWAALGIWLGRTQQRLAAGQADSSVPSSQRRTL
jgi:AAA family ATP:ADP antiporter